MEQLQAHSDEKIINDRINRLKNLGTPQISDAFNKLKINNCICSGLIPLQNSPPSKICGLAFTATYANNDDSAPKLFESNRYLLDEISPALTERVNDNYPTVLMIENRGTFGIASVWGFLVSFYAKQKNILGTITNGHVRDAKEINDIKYPVFCSGKHFQNSNDFYKVTALQKPIILQGVTIHPGDYILADESGIAIISPLIIDQIITFAEQKQKDELKIARLMKNGYSLKEINKIMITMSCNPNS